MDENEALISLSAGPYTAEVAVRGATLAGLTHDGRDVVARAPDAEWGRRGYFGSLLAPWPNRVADGRYTFEGVEHRLPLTEPDRGTALHGLVHDVDWSVAPSAAGASDAVELHCALRSPEGYPFDLDLTATYRLGEDGLACAVEAVNVGAATAPYGVGFHPYLTVGRPVDECVLTLPAATRLDADDRGIPVGSGPVARTPYDFRAGRLVGDTRIDHCFGDLIEFAGQTRVALIDPGSGRSASLTVGAPFRWLQVFTGDTLGAGARESVAVEPMTCPPDAFRSGVDVEALPPGGVHRAAFVIAASAGMTSTPKT